MIYISSGNENVRDPAIMQQVRRLGTLIEFNRPAPQAIRDYRKHWAPVVFLLERHESERLAMAV
jgi:hypothetical protein